MSSFSSSEICVIAPFPTQANEKDGMIQRVAHIDEIMADVPRTYLYISIKHHWRMQMRIEGLVTIHSLNIFMHFLHILRIMRAAKLIYIHSAYNALYAMLFPTRAKIVFDAHGVVPEELLAMDRKWMALVMGRAESSILNRCDVLVCVTRSMLEHFHRKYGLKPGREEIVLPILPKFGGGECADLAISTLRDANSVIYAGGMQVWQNVDGMISAARQQPHLNYTFLTGLVDDFSAKLRSGNVQKFRCESVAPDRVKEYYLTHQFGFILREDNIINAVACPTKLVEYVFWGVIPIAITPCIGDFDFNSLRIVTLEQFVAGELPDVKSAHEMRVHNQKTMLKLISAAHESHARLKQQLFQWQLSRN